MQEIRRILFIRTDRMGDLLMNLPALRLLRQTYPKSWITALVDESAADLLKGHPDIDEVMTVTAKKIKGDIGYRFKLAGVLRKAQFDLAVVSNPDKFLHLLIFLAGIPIRAGYRRKWGFLLTKSMLDGKARAERHEMEMNIELVKLVSDKMWDGDLRLPVDEPAKKRVEELLNRECPGGREILAVHPGTSNPEKRWPVDRWAAFCNLVSHENRKIILIGGPEEREVSSQVQRRAGAVLDWTGALSLKELAAFLGHPRIKLLVSSDSGPVHIAWISGTPVVALYAKNVAGSNPVRWGPRDSKSEVIYKPMQDITAEEVYEAVKKVSPS